MHNFLLLLPLLYLAQFLVPHSHGRLFLQQRLSTLSPTRSSGHRTLPRPAFGSSPNLQALVHEVEERADLSGPPPPAAVFYEVTIASIDQAKLLSRLSESLGDLGLNICEAHAFNTKDRFALDVFLVNGWMGGVSECECTYAFGRQYSSQRVESFGMIALVTLVWLELS